MASSVNSTSIENVQVNMQLMALAKEKMQANIAMRLIESAIIPINTEPQDPQTVTSEQLKSPIDIRV
jgi:hypothetical protein